MEIFPSIFPQRSIPKREEIESKVAEFKIKLEKKHTLIDQYKKRVDILFLSCDKELREKAAKMLNDSGYNALTIEDFKKDYKFLTEFEIEKEAIKIATVIIAIEPNCIDGDIKRCPGLVQECTLIMNERKFQDKTVLVVDERLDYLDITNLENLHYLYFPKIYRCPYDNQEKLVELCIAIAKKKVHRQVMNFLNDGNI